MPDIRRQPVRVLGLLAVVALSACDRVEPRDRPLPKIEAATLDGERLDLDSLRGKPWIINVWVPG